MKEKTLARMLRINRGFIACDEVSNYGHRADVLAVDKNKKMIYEYEFKRNSNDLKNAEFKKDKYAPYKQYKSWWDKNGKYQSTYIHMTEFPKPNYFYFVMPEDLWEKEHIFLKNLNIGVMSFNKESGFYVTKRCPKTIKNVQKFDRVLENICIRLANLYVWSCEKDTPCP